MNDTSMSSDPRLSSSFKPRQQLVFNGLDFYIQPRGHRLSDFFSVCKLIEDYGGRVCSQPCHNGPLTIIVFVPQNPDASTTPTLYINACRPLMEARRRNDWTANELVKYFGRVKGATQDKHRKRFSVLTADWLAVCASRGTLVPKDPWEVVGEIDRQHTSVVVPALQEGFQAPRGPRAANGAFTGTSPLTREEQSDAPKRSNSPDDGQSGLGEAQRGGEPEVATAAEPGPMSSGRQTVSVEVPHALAPSGFTIGQRNILYSPQGEASHTPSPTSATDAGFDSAIVEQPAINQSTHEHILISDDQPSEQERFSNTYGLPVTFHVLTGRHKAILDIVIRKELGGYTTTSDAAQFVVVPAGVSLTDPSQRAVVQAVQANPTRAVVSSEWIEACLEQKKILYHGPYKFKLQEDLPPTPSGDVPSYCKAERKRESPGYTDDARRSKKAGGVAQ